MPDRLFLFTQFEFPWELGPADGRYLMRTEEAAEPERVVVLGTLGAQRRAPTRGQLWSAATRSGTRKRTADPEPEPAPIATTRATIVDPVSLSAERQAQAWLSDIDGEREIRTAISALNRVLHFYRIAAADPHVHEVSPEQALVIRAGWGEGEQVADGVWAHAVELPWQGSGGVRKKRIGDRAAALRPQERLAVLLGARGVALLCEDLALRARADLEQGRTAHAALELQAAYAAALAELPAEHREDLAIRIAELQKLHTGVDAQARAALVAVGGVGDAGALGTGDHAEASHGDRVRASASDDEDAARASHGPLDEDAARTSDGPLDADVLGHALGRLEAALRARTATGFRLK